MLTDPSREKTAVEITKFLAHKHYCENNFLAGEDLLDDPFLWFGAGEDEFLNGSKAELVALFRQFEGKVPRCNITGEEYHTLMASPDVCLCTGRMWISTDPATGVYLQVHQRAAACIGAAFPGRAYRIGGDEFAVVLEQADFLAAAAEARARLRGAGVDISIGLCWQESACDVWKQYDEADRRMYREKQVYYQQAGKERRRNR